jgi:hypothetical protein
MKHIKLYESFGRFGDRAGMRSSGGKTMVEITLDGENPDVKYGGTIVGVGNTRREAAEFALQMACHFLQNGDPSETIKRSDLNSPSVNDLFASRSDIQRALEMLEMGEIQQMRGGYSEAFSSHGDAVYAEATVSPAPSSAPIGGSVTDHYFEEEY